MFLSVKHNIIYNAVSLPNIGGEGVKVTITDSDFEEEVPYSDIRHHFNLLPHSDWVMVQSIIHLYEKKNLDPTNNIYLALIFLSSQRPSKNGQLDEGLLNTYISMSRFAAPGIEPYLDQISQKFQTYKTFR